MPGACAGLQRVDLGADPSLAKHVGDRAGYEASSNQNSAWGGARAGAKVAGVHGKGQCREQGARAGGVAADGDHAAAPAVARARKHVGGEHPAQQRAHGPGCPGGRRTASARRRARRWARAPARGAGRAAGRPARTRPRRAPEAGAGAEESRTAGGERPPAAAPDACDRRATAACADRRSGPRRSTPAARGRTPAGPRNGTTARAPPDRAPRSRSRRATSSATHLCRLIHAQRACAGPYEQRLHLQACAVTGAPWPASSRRSPAPRRTRRAHGRRCA